MINQSVRQVVAVEINLEKVKQQTAIAFITKAAENTLNGVSPGYCELFSKLELNAKCL